MESEDEEVEKEDGEVEGKFGEVEKGACMRRVFRERPPPVQEFPEPPPPEASFAPERVSPWSEFRLPPNWRGVEGGVPALLQPTTSRPCFQNLW